MIDYFFEMSAVKTQLLLHDYDKNKITIAYNYAEKTGTLKLVFNNSEKWVIEGKALDWRSLPVLQDKIHYTIDEIK